MKEQAKILIGWIVGLVVILACIWLMLSVSRAAQQKSDLAKPLLRESGKSR